MIDDAALARQSLPARLVDRARRTPGRVAYRAKTLGVYRETTWRELADRVAAVALGLRARGLRPRDRVAIMGHPRPEWMIADLAVQVAGGISCGVYPTSSPAELRYVLRHAGARFMVAEDQEPLDKALAVSADCPMLERIFVVDTRALFAYRDERIATFAALEADGRARLASEPTALAELSACVGPDDPATIVYTSGTTADPKGAVLLHGRHVAAAANMLGHYPLLAQGEHRTVAFLPLSHVMGRNATITLPLLADIVPHYPEDPDTVAEALFEVAPTFLFTVPRYLQKIASHVLVGLESSSTIKRAAYHAAMRVGRVWIERHWARRPSAVVTLGYLLARGLVLKWLLDKVGFARLRLVLSGGAPLPPAVAALWQIWGVNVLEVYGQTEEGGAIISGQQGERPRPGDVGVAAPNVRIALDDDGEIVVSGPHFFAGYWSDDAATTATLTADGLRTGDVGAWTAAGTLTLVDRKRDFVITAGGKNVSPAQVENALRSSPYVAEATVFGDGRKYLVALLELDYETVAEWARAHGIAYTGYTSLVTHAETVALIEREVAQANELLARAEQVKAFRVLPRELDPEQEGEPVTPTRKVKRRLLAERYGALLDAMYGDAEERRIAAELSSLDTTLRA